MADELASRRARRHPALHALRVVAAPQGSELVRTRARPIHAKPVTDGVSLNIAGWYITLSPTEAQRLVAETTAALGELANLKEQP